MVPSASSGPHSAIQRVVQRPSERRRAHRARLGASVTITTAGKLVDALGMDVSQGGMRVVASVPARVGDQVSLVFFLEGETRDIVSATGTVQWCAEGKRGLAMFGVRFTTLDEDGASLVASYCRASVS
jgi:c-di-GMP-binding flagellar brake protein YcgR